MSVRDPQGRRAALVVLRRAVRLLVAGDRPGALRLANALRRDLGRARGDAS